MEIAAGSNVGFWQRRRTDGYLTEALAPGVTLLAVADGFGAAGKGMPAAEVALGTLRDYLRRRQRSAPPLRRSPGHMRNQLLAALDVVNARLYAQSGSHEDFVGSGTSLTAIVVAHNHAFVGHAGDSRAYLLRMGSLELLTADDAVFPDRVLPTAKTAVQSRQRARGLLWRSLGTQPKLEASIAHVELMPGDRLLLSTDGIHRSLGDDEIAEILGSGANPADGVNAMMTLARDRGAGENGTVVVARELLVASAPALPARRAERFRNAMTVLLLVACAFCFALYALRFGPVAH